MSHNYKIDFYSPDSQSFNSHNPYRFGFNGMELDNEIQGDGNSYDFGARIYNSRLGRWLSVDKCEKKYVPISQYVLGINNPIYFIDIDGNIVYGTDGKPVTIEKNNAGEWVIKGKPYASTEKLFNAMIKTPKGVESVQSYTDIHGAEFRFLEVSASSPDLNGAHARFFTSTELRLDNDKDYFGIMYTLENTSENPQEDRMTTWSVEEKANVIGVHEKSHESNGSVVDAEDKFTNKDELVSRFQYSILYPSNSSPINNWLSNYQNKLGSNKIKKAYNQAVKGLVKNGNISKEMGKELKKTIKQK